MIDKTKNIELETLKKTLDTKEMKGVNKESLLKSIKEKQENKIVSK